eukprot:55879-Eustigmatos_ZCMA.PRE.1
MRMMGAAGDENGGVRPCASCSSSLFAGRDAAIESVASGQNHGGEGDEMAVLMTSLSMCLLMEHNDDAGDDQL